MAAEFGARLESVRSTVPLVHCITNYVTVHDVANVLIACGGSPIMSDEPADVADITSICGALYVNIGTLNARTIEVGAGASALRTETAAHLLETYPVCCVRANMSEIKALAMGSSTTRGVDVAPDDAVTDGNLDEMAAFVRRFSAASGAVVVASGAIDLVSDAETTYAIRNGHPLMGQITGSGCMLSGVVAAYVAANPESRLQAAAAAVSMFGLAGELAAARAERDGAGNATYSNYLIDGVFGMDAAALERGARHELR